MATILLPTDFSDNALNAARYAVTMFNEPNTRFIILNAVEQLHTGATVMKSMDAILAKEAKTKLLEFEKRLGEQVDLTPFKVERQYEQGDLPSVIDMLEEAEHVDLIVMGTQGATELEEIFMGSTTSDVIKSVEQPSLAIPTNSTFKEPKHILLADDGEEIDGDTVRILMKIGRKYASTIHVVRMIEQDEEEGDAEPSNTDFEDLFNDIDLEQHFIKGDDLDEALDAYVDRNNIDLVVMVHHHLNLFERLFHRSASKRMAMHTHVPLLVLQQ